MPNLQLAIASSLEHYPRTSSALYQLLLSVMTFVCVLSIARYDHNPDGSPPVFLTPSERNATHEHICKISAREADIPVGALRYLIPHFMLCPSIFTLIAMCSVFIICSIKWRSFHVYSPVDIMPLPIVITVLSIKWTRILESLQMTLPLGIWTCYAARALIDPMFKLLMPVTYARQVENKKARWIRGKDKDIEVLESRPLDEQTPLTG